MIKICSPEELLNFIKNNSRYAIWKETGITQTTLSNYVNGVTPIKKMTIENAIKLTEYINNQEDIKMTQEELLEFIKGELRSIDEEIRDNLYDVYYQPSYNNVWLMESGMEYSGDDNKAKYIAQIENQEVINWA